MSAKLIFLVGLSGAGKSTVGKLLAEKLVWAFADSDAEVEAEAGRSIPELFRDEGEASFRDREAAALAALCERQPIVVATGGGAPTHDASRAIIDHGFSVWLSISPEEAAERLRADPATPTRPLLEGDLEGKLRSLLDARGDIYRNADAAIDVSGLSPEQAAAEIFHLFEEWRAAPRGGDREGEGRNHGSPNGAPSLSVAATVRTVTEHYPVIVQDGALEHLGEACRFAGLSGRAFVVTDDAVGPLFADRALKALRAAGYVADTTQIPAGEGHKTLATVAALYDWLIASRVERGDFVVCLGGGVVTDLAGFAAATCLRGIPFVHVPTSLLGMVDAAIGGKTGVDHPRGKNLIGAFAQPKAVVIDPRLLTSLPERHLRNGWAEVIKHGFILDEDLTRELEAVAGEPAAMMSARLIARSVAIKAEIVSEDEREAGRRTLLNYGHTVGHAIEAVTGFHDVLHGEAVALGMRVAGIIAGELGLLSADDFERQQRLIRAAGLPESLSGVDVDAVLDATLLDKKVRDGDITWVLLDGIGHAVTRSGVPAPLVRTAVETVLR